MDNVLGYAGKRVIVSGAASGMGAATTKLLVELGAEVHAVDIKKPDMSGLASFTETDLREPAEIDAAVHRIGKIVDCLFSCAGLPNTFSNLDVMLVNFCGLRHLTEAVIPNMVEGGAIASIASSAGIGWLTNMDVLGELLATPDFAAARAWCEEHPRQIVNGYGLFRVMTTERPEIVIEGSNDKKNWLAYDFKYKPGPLNRAPRFTLRRHPGINSQGPCFRKQCPSY